MWDNAGRVMVGWAIFIAQLMAANIFIRTILAHLAARNPDSRITNTLAIAA